MIAATPVARWTWGHENSQPEEKVAACLRELLIAWSVAAKHELVVGIPSISLSIHEAGKSNSYLFRGNLELDASLRSPNLAKGLARRVEASLSPGVIGSVYANAKVANMVSSSRTSSHEEGLVQLGASAVLDYVGVDIVTYSDVWMPFDLKGRAQPTIHAANAPRLSVALQDLSEALRSETDPDDPTRFGKPTESGVDNYRDRDGSASDVWSSFEIPYRYSKFTQTPGFGRIGYRRSAEGAVQYVPVRGKKGTLGYLWASDAEKAASFEPLDVGDDEVYVSGLTWLDRLRSAYDRGLSPSEALAELASLSEDHKANTLDLSSLRELANSD
ncbi:hypothetical protein [[Kitasatospora] papulosa]|uniref:hypothetical protein n=1 Tax=[Kitasatospora] papulosa TaxID=1464011 RepID=UPI00367CA155